MKLNNSWPQKLQMGWWWNKPTPRIYSSYTQMEDRIHFLIKLRLKQSHPTRTSQKSKEKWLPDNINMTKIKKELPLSIQVDLWNHSNHQLLQEKISGKLILMLRTRKSSHLHNWRSCGSRSYSFRKYQKTLKLPWRRRHSRNWRPWMQSLLIQTCKPVISSRIHQSMKGI